jgi:hypothetical protein
MSRRNTTRIAGGFQERMKLPILNGLVFLCIAIAAPRGPWQSGKLDIIFSVSPVSVIV